MSAFKRILVPTDFSRDPEVSDCAPGIPRLGIPALQSSEASMGVTIRVPAGRQACHPFPASIAVGSSFNPQLARDGSVAIGREARSRGFNIQLAGGINLARDVRNGLNFEY